MDQLTQKLKDGTMKVLETPIPALGPGQILVRNHYSLISAGTEGSTVKAARKGYIGKAKERPQQVKQVIDTLVSQGPTQTYRAVMKKLDAYSPLGYSSVGEVIAVGAGVEGYRIGDFVACGGLTASHAEIISVPVNLTAKLHPEADMKQAAYNTLGAIALQGVRQADLRLGESCAVIGLGLLGQLTLLLLQAAGVKSIGIDIDQSMVEVARRHAAEQSFVRHEPGLKDKILNYTGGLGCDGVIITAATDSLDPINFAGAVARKKGTVVVVGDVPTGFDRDPHYYKKEIQIKMSCSYGPGRYDPVYEEKGIDYPAAYVRWTEQRNMQAFQDLLRTGKIDVSYLTTHIFPLDEAPTAYDLMISKAKPFIGILIEYDRAKTYEPVSGRVDLARPKVERTAAEVRIGFIGAGSYAQSHLLPNVSQIGHVSLRGVMTATGASARSVGERYGFKFCTTQAKDILDNEEINTVFIATRHDTHAAYVLEAIKAGKNIFIEKPLCLRPEELEEIKTVYETSVLDPIRSSPILMVGYNRRFSPMVLEMKKHFGQGPIAAVYRINSGSIPPDSWIQDPEVGGGRVIGEVCHFIDTITFLAGSLPVKVYAVAMSDPHGLQDTLNVSLIYENGSIGTISYLANGDKKLAKERLEVFGHGSTAVLDDFKSLTIYSGGRKNTNKKLGQDKGQPNEVAEFIAAVRQGSGEVIPFVELYNASRVSFKILDSLKENHAVCV